MKLFTKPRAVEAVQWFKDGDHPRVLVNLGIAWTCNHFGFPIKEVPPGDWIITHEDGRIEVMTDAEVKEGLLTSEKLLEVGMEMPVPTGTLAAVSCRQCRYGYGIPGSCIHPDADSKPQRPCESFSPFAKEETNGNEQ